MPDIKNEPILKDGEPCSHPGCLSHVSHPCEGCGRIGGYRNPGPPETIYLQCYDEYTGNLLDFVSDDVTWCRDRINDNDAVYILATPELAALLERLSEIVPAWGDGAVHRADLDEARALAACIRDKMS